MKISATRQVQLSPAALATEVGDPVADGAAVCRLFESPRGSHIDDDPDQVLSERSTNRYISSGAVLRSVQTDASSLGTQGQGVLMDQMRFALTSAATYWTQLRPDDPFPVHLDCSERLDSNIDGEWECPKCRLKGGLLVPTHPNQSSAFGHSLLEAASWRLASDLALRHPKLRIHRAVPHPGTSDVLVVAPAAFRPQNGIGPALFLNVAPRGRIHVVKRSDGIEPDGGPWKWDEYLSVSDAEEFLNRVEHAAGLWQGHEDREPTTEALTYALIARIAALHAFDTAIAISNGYTGNAGSADWWEEIADHRATRLAIPNDQDPVGEPGHRFWRIEHGHNFQLTLESSTGTAWGGEYDPSEVALLGYDEGEMDLADELSPPGNRQVLDTALSLGGL